MFIIEFVSYCIDNNLSQVYYNVNDVRVHILMVHFHMNFVHVDL